MSLTSLAWQVGSLLLEPPGKPDLEYKNLFKKKEGKNTYTRFGVEVNIYFEWDLEEVHTRGNLQFNLYLPQINNPDHDSALLEKQTGWEHDGFNVNGMNFNPS